jgi:hypothetical protein
MSQGRAAFISSPLKIDSVAELDGSRRSTSGQGGLEGALVQARALLDLALRESRERQSTSSAVVEYFPTVDLMLTEIFRLIPTVRREFLATSPSVGWYLKSPEHLEVMRQSITRMVQRGVTARKLYTAEAISKLLATPGYRAGFGEAGPQVRVASTPLSNIVILDASKAFIRAAHARGREQCMMIRVPAILKSLRTFFKSAWDSAIDLDVYLQQRESNHDETDAWIMRMLSKGYKDDVAARELGVSVRTYRRRVADIMRNLDATSRFQAGVRAAELGLIDKRA